MLLDFEIEPKHNRISAFDQGVIKEHRVSEWEWTMIMLVRGNSIRKSKDGEKKITIEMS